VKIKILFIALSTINLFGCVSTAPKNPPNYSSPKIVIENRIPKLNEKYGAATDIPDSYFGIRGASGSVAVGLLFGPLGVLANTHKANSENIEFSKKIDSITKINVNKIFENIDISDFTTSSNERTSFFIIPSAVVSFNKDQKFTITCNISAKNESNTGKKWVGNYMNEPLYFYSPGDDNIKVVASKNIENCFTELTSIFKSHITGSLGEIEKKRFMIGESMVNLNVFVKEYPERIITQTGNLVRLFDKRNIKVIDQ